MSQVCIKWNPHSRSQTLFSLCFALFAEQQYGPSTQA